MLPCPFHTALGAPSADQQVPQQPNFSDCGLYLIHFTEQLVNHPYEVLDTVRVSIPLDCMCGTIKSQVQADQSVPALGCREGWTRCAPSSDDRSNMGQARHRDPA